ncbi:MAG: four helix bundle protein, partial [Deltaproteobacteria bacterium]|nr:four helix bundle protein [Deltaproteobacteria bacterium]
MERRVGFQRRLWWTLKKTACDWAQDAVSHDHKNSGGLASIVGQCVDISVIGPFDLLYRPEEVHDVFGPGQRREISAYQKLCKLHIEVCDLSHKWPQEERYELGSQVRRSSNSSP